MIITRTPLRVSFAGGLSDIPAYYNRLGEGKVTSVTINKYVYVMVNDKFDNDIRVAYKKYEDVSKVSDISHPIVKACLKKFKVKEGIEISTIADIPGGTGLGSSSAFTVGLVNALSTYCGHDLNKRELAEYACEIEIDTLKENIGKQDQYACAFGGFNKFTFHRGESVVVDPIHISKGCIHNMEDRLLMFYLQSNGKSSDVLKDQIATFEENSHVMLNLLHIADDIYKKLNSEDIEIGELLHKAWGYKKQMKGVTDKYIDSLYAKCLYHGAQGGKVCGAGGRGFLMMYATPGYKGVVRSKIDVPYVDVKFEDKGSVIVYDDS